MYIMGTFNFKYFEGISQHLITYLLSFALFLVVRHSTIRRASKRNSGHFHGEKPAKKAAKTKPKSSSKKASAKRTGHSGVSGTKKKKKQQHFQSGQSISQQLKKATSKSSLQKSEYGMQQGLRQTGRPEDEVVTYTEVEFELKEIPSRADQILIGPTRLTRFEKARITGARSLQLSLGAPSLIKIPPEVRDSISLAVAELEAKALPISIRRVLPNGLYQDIPIDWMRV